MTAEPHTDSQLRDLCVAFVGKLGGMNRRQARQLVREHGGTAVSADDERVDWVVIGADELPLNVEDELLTPQVREAAAVGRVQVLSEREF